MNTVITEIRDKLGIIYINRPQARNALTPDLIKGITESVIRYQRTDNVRAIAIAGSGEHAFAAGCDVSVLSSMDSETVTEFMAKGHRCMRTIEGCTKPVIAMVNGYALGGGFEIVLACDIVVASDGASFGFPEVRLGLIPGFGGTQRLPRRIGFYRAKELILTGDVINARTAHEWGLINRLVPQGGKLMDAAQEVFDGISAASPFALDAAKRAINGGIESSLDNGLGIERAEFMRCFDNPDAKEGLAAFLNYRTPLFR